jgi:hypothetical protein
VTGEVIADVPVPHQQVWSDGRSDNRRACDTSTGVGVTGGVTEWNACASDVSTCVEWQVS